MSDPYHFIPLQRDYSLAWREDRHTHTYTPTEYLLTSFAFCFPHSLPSPTQTKLLSPVACCPQVQPSRQKKQTLQPRSVVHKCYWLHVQNPLHPHPDPLYTHSHIFKEAFWKSRLVITLWVTMYQGYGLLGWGGSVLFQEPVQSLLQSMKKSSDSKEEKELTHKPSPQA